MVWLPRQYQNPFLIPVPRMHCELQTWPSLLSASFTVTSLLITHTCPQSHLSHCVSVSINNVLKAELTKPRFDTCTDTLVFWFLASALSWYLLITWAFCLLLVKSLDSCFGFDEKPLTCVWICFLTVTYCGYINLSDANGFNTVSHLRWYCTRKAVFSCLNRT